MKPEKLMILMALITAFSPVLITGAGAQEFIIPVRNEGEITGRIESIDHDAAVMTVRVYSNGEMQSYTDDKVYIKREVLIEENGETFGIDDLATGQNITVQYRVSLDGKKEAEHIWINEK